MAANKSPYPSFVRIFYHSPFAPHVMTLPTHTYIASTSLATPGVFVPWSGINIAADAMIEGLITLLAAMYNNDVNFDRYEIWTKNAPTDIPDLRYQKTHSVAGSGTLTGWSEAVQRTYFMRTTANGAFKLVLLDSPTDNLFAKYYVLTTPENAFIAYLSNSAYAFQGRDGYQPVNFKDLTITLNNRLRREYHLR